MAIDVASGRKRRIILTGVFDKSFASNDIIAYIQIVSGAIKAHEYGKEDTDPTHYTADGLWTGGAKSFVPGTVIGGRLNRIISADSSIYIICYYGN